MPDDAVAVVREEISRLLERYAIAPAMFLREADYQAALWSAVHARLGLTAPGTPVSVVSKDGRPTAHSYMGLQTARAHVEIEVLDGTTKFCGPVDLAVLRSDVSPRLVCPDFGPSDFWQRLRGEDLAVVVEIKAAPSSYSGKPREFGEDLEKLGAIKRRFPHISPMFLLFDKAISLKASRGNKRPAKWEAALGLDLSPRPRPGRNEVDLWDLQDGEDIRVRQRFAVL